MKPIKKNTKILDQILVDNVESIYSMLKTELSKSIKDDKGVYSHLSKSLEYADLSYRLYLTYKRMYSRLKYDFEKMYSRWMYDIYKRFQLERGGSMWDIAPNKDVMKGRVIAEHKEDYERYNEELLDLEIIVEAFRSLAEQWNKKQSNIQTQVRVTNDKAYEF